MNSLVELHDSILAGVTIQDADAVLSLRPAYVHKSLGRPGVDPGTGWTQDADIRIARATVLGSPGLLPARIADGNLSVGGQDHPNAVPMSPVAQPVVLGLIMETGNSIEVRGQGLSLMAIGDSRYVEEFPGASSG